MHLFKRSITSILAVAIFSLSALGQQQGTVSGQVQDELGAAVVGATVTVVNPEGRVRTLTTNQRGEFTVSGLVPGIYTVRIAVPNFAIYENN
ncbi:MAG TPA: hypothetical protein DEP46_17500, partial [Blastocatellia bacterium]|nr:hypothetical protein [Blastocatellia bacterium]